MSDNKKSIAKEIELYTSHLESLSSTLPLTMMFLQEAGKHYRSDFDKFIKENCEIEHESENNKTIKIKPEHHKDYKKKSFDSRNLAMARGLVPRSFLVSMVSQYDAYLGRLLKAIYLSRPETFNNAGREYTFAEISIFSSIEEFKEHAIEREVEALLRDSHADQFKKLQSKFTITLTKDLSIWPTFIELTERRNLFVHCDGIVSKQYLAVCKDHGVDISNINEGDKLSVPQEYSMMAYRCLYEIGVKLGQVLWRKVLPKEKEWADDSLISATYDLIDRGEYDLACSILDDGLKIWKGKFENEKNHLFLVINCAQAHKWAGREDRCRAILSDHDWSAKEDRFKLAAASLKEDWAECTKIMKKMGDSGDVKDVEYRNWPLFQKLRKQKSFLDDYKQIFGKSFESKIINENIPT